MKLGIMQPYFFPYLGYIELIFATDQWVVFDITQYTHKSWLSRNRILHPSSGWQYIFLQLNNASRTQRIHEATVKNPKESRDKLLRQLEHYKKSAPYYSQVCNLVHAGFDSANDNSLVGVNTGTLQAVTNYLDIPFNFQVCSHMNLPLPPVQHPGGWALEICSLLGADHYINPPGGRELFRPEEFSERSIKLSFMDIPEFSYTCGPYAFEPHLSILDVLMWNSPETVRAYLGKTSVSWAD